MGALALPVRADECRRAARRYGAALRLLARGTGIERPLGWTRLAWGSWGVVLIAAVFQLGLTAADMSGLLLRGVVAAAADAQRAAKRFDGELAR